MLVKKLHFDPDVLNVLRSMRWDDDGKLGAITSGQLERGLYERLNKALSAMGGKWSRKRGGHVFQSDPRPLVDGLLDTGVLEVARDGFFETPPAVVDRILELLPFPEGGEVLEPSAGMGAIVDRLPDKDRLRLVEFNEGRAAELRRKGYFVHEMDFMDYLTSIRFSAAYMNPPFEQGQDIDHIRRAFSMLSDGGALVSVAAEGSFTRSDRRAAEFQSWLESVGAYVEALPDGSFKPSGTMVRARLVLIHKESK